MSITTRGNSQIPFTLTDSFVHIFLLLRWKKARLMHVSVADPKAGQIQVFPNSKHGCEKLLLLPANKVCEGYVFTGVCLSTGGSLSREGLCLGGSVQGVSV